MRRLLAVPPAVLLAVAVLAPAATAHHPGSNHGLALFDPLDADMLVHRLPDVQQDFAEWEAQWPGYVSRFVMGSTSSGFPLEAIVVTDESVAFDQAGLNTGHKLRVYLDGGHHGNEFLGVELVMYYLEDLLAKAEAGDKGTLALLRTTEIYAVPIINVDGNFLDTRKNGRLVDPNRNYDYQWGGPGSGDSIVELTYRGPSPASEAEVRANQDFATKIRPDLWITMHTGVAEFYWPWGWTSDPAPDQAFFESLEEPFEAATNGRVDAMQAAELYLAAGATDDWGYAILGVPTHTYEVHEDQDIPVYGQTIPVAISDQLAGLDFMVQNVKHMGAWLEWRIDGGDIVIRNDGWNVARGARLSGELLPDIPRDGELRLPAPTQDTALHYPQMLIETSKVRTVPVVIDASSSTPQAEMPGMAAPLALLALVALALAGMGGRR